jgi:hypothetical protein
MRVRTESGVRGHLRAAVVDRVDTALGRRLPLRHGRAPRCACRRLRVFSVDRPLRRSPPRPRILLGSGPSTADTPMCCAMATRCLASSTPSSPRSGHPPSPGVARPNGPRCP